MVNNLLQLLMYIQLIIILVKIEDNRLLILIHILYN